MENRFFLLLVTTVTALIFSPPSFAAEPRGGDVIDSTNIDQYKDYLPSFLARFVKDGWGFEAPVVLSIGEPKDWPITDAFRKASEGNIGKAKLTPEGLIEGYTGVDVPFPNPQEPDLALKIMWNQFYKDLPEDWSLPYSYLTFSKRKGGSIAVFDSVFDCLKFSGRTILPPLPELPNPKGLYWASIINSKTPPHKDMATLTWRYKDPLKTDDMWTYVPTLRRTIRMVSAERANPMRGSASTWDEIFCFDGKIPLFTYKLLRKEKTLMLANQVTTGDKLPNKMYSHPVLFGPNDPYELVDAYVIELKSKDPRYPTSKWDLWVRDRHWAGVYSEIYDKRGEFWKGITLAFHVRPLGNSKTDLYALRLGGGTTDFKTLYWSYSIVGALNTNSDLDPHLFDPGALSGG
jgi:hypothetical protein